MRSAFCQLVVNFAKEEMAEPGFRFGYGPNGNPSGYMSISHMESDMSYYVERLEQGFECSAEAFIVAAVYLIRLREIVPLTRLQLRAALVTTLSLATKFLDDDDTRSPASVCAYAGDISLSDLSSMEATLLHTLNWRLFVDESEFAIVRCRLEALWVRLFVPVSPPHHPAAACVFGQSPAVVADPFLPQGAGFGIPRPIHPPGMAPRGYPAPPVHHSHTHCLPALNHHGLPLSGTGSVFVNEPAKLAQMSRDQVPAPYLPLASRVIQPPRSVETTPFDHGRVHYLPSRPCAVPEHSAYEWAPKPEYAVNEDDWLQFIDCSFVDSSTWPSAMLYRTPPSLPVCKRPRVPPPVRF